MSTAGWILFWTFAFAASHMGLSSLRVRPRLVGLLGVGPYLGLYSVVSFATFVPLVTVYVRDIHGGALLWNLRDVPGVWPAAMALSWVSFTLALAAIAQPSPASIGPTSTTRSFGLTRITRHPLFMNIGIWAFAHVLVNGFVHDVLFFGGIFAVGLLGCMHQDARKRVTERGRLDAFFAETSLLPFVAILRGRNRFVASELPWVALGVAAATSTGLYLAHPLLFR